MVTEEVDLEASVLANGFGYGEKGLYEDGVVGGGDGPG